MLYGYQAFFLKPPPKPAPQTGSPEASRPAEVEAAVSPAVPSQSAASTSGQEVAKPNVTVGDLMEREVRVETRDVIATLTNRGGRLKSWRLKKYLDAKGAPLELVASELSEKFPLPLSLRASNDATTTALNSALYAVGGQPSGLAAQESPTTLTFEYSDSSGLRVTKEVKLEPSSYLDRKSVV